MILQQYKDKVKFGTPDLMFTLKVERGRIKADEVDAAREALVEAHPCDADTINCYAERLLRMAG